MEENSFEQFKTLIRNAGLRATPARIATLKLLHGATSPLTHADVSAELDGLGIDKATVFRNLNDLVAAGLLRRTELGDHVWRFEVISEHDQNSGSHPHFVCVDCGNVSCIDEVELTSSSEKIRKRFGEVTEILLRGHCNDCG